MPLYFRNQNLHKIATSFFRSITSTTSNVLWTIIFFISLFTSVRFSTKSLVTIRHRLRQIHYHIQYHNLNLFLCRRHTYILLPFKRIFQIINFEKPTFKTADRIILSIYPQAHSLQIFLQTY